MYVIACLWFYFTGNVTNVQFVRHQTTGIDLLRNQEITKRKRFQKNKRYFTELLEGGYWVG